MQTKLISITPDCEKIIMYCARVSNPKNQDSGKTGLLKYCLKHGHWSIFQMGNLTIEVETSRAISAQIIRHTSLSIQEFSQRYSEVQQFETYQARRQDSKNRQNSIDDMTTKDQQWFLDAQKQIQNLSSKLYKKALDKQIAKEQARFLLPMSATTKLYLNGSIRSWITYLMVRLDKSTQLEHRQIAEEIWKIFKKELPIIADALKEIKPEIFV